MQIGEARVVGEDLGHRFAEAEALLKALEKHPENRQQTAQELLYDMQQAADATTRPLSVAPRIWRRREVLLTATAPLVALAVTGNLTVIRCRPPDEAAGAVLARTVPARAAAPAQ